MSGKSLSDSENAIQQSRRNANTIIIKKLKEHSAKIPATVILSPLKKTCLFEKDDSR